MDREMKIEQKQLVPRKEIISALKLALKEGKEVYIVSDMYLPQEFYIKVLEQHGISLSPDNIWVSHILDASKSDGTLWEIFCRKSCERKKSSTYWR